jgi:hypothetical protein
MGSLLPQPPGVFHKAVERRRFGVAKVAKLQLVRAMHLPCGWVSHRGQLK